MIAVLASLLLSTAATPDAAPAACSPDKLVQTGFAPGQLKRLEDLPPGLVTLTVMRTVGGCNVREIRYDGVTYYIPAGPQGEAKIERRPELFVTPQADRVPRIRPSDAPSHN
jgi:hypothetical protein